MKIIDVVAAVIIDDDGKILIAKRKKGKTLENYWEFPGGKVENNESETDCLKREMYEEFGVEINISKYLTTSKHNQFQQQAIEGGIWHTLDKEVPENCLRKIGSNAKQACNFYVTFF